jgi:hypothetical protein
MGKLLFDGQFFWGYAKASVNTELSIAEPFLLFGSHLIWEIREDYYPDFDHRQLGQSRSAAGNDEYPFELSCSLSKRAPKSSAMSEYLIQALKFDPSQSWLVEATHLSMERAPLALVHVPSAVPCWVLSAQLCIL